mgnify:CR=1 FL=1
MSNDKFDTARQVLRQQKLTGERALFQSENLADGFCLGRHDLKLLAAVDVYLHGYTVFLFILRSLISLITLFTLIVHK